MTANKRSNEKNSILFIIGRILFRLIRIICLALIFYYFISIKKAVGKILPTAGMLRVVGIIGKIESSRSFLVFTGLFLVPDFGVALVALALNGSQLDFYSVRILFGSGSRSFIGKH